MTLVLALRDKTPAPKAMAYVAAQIARSLSDTFAGIAPTDAPMVILRQLIGAPLALWVAKGLFN